MISEHPLFWVGNRNPSISDQITSTDPDTDVTTGVDLTASTVRFRMRRPGSDALVVDELVSSKDALGNWRYDWSAADVTAIGDGGTFLVWVNVNDGAKTEDVSEALIEWRAHAPVDQPAYVDLEELKSTLQMSGISYADLDFQTAVQAASRDVDAYCGRRFWLDPVASTRYYDASSSRYVIIDDLASTTSFALVTYPYGYPSGGGSTWPTTAYVLEPLNALAEGKPYERIRVRAAGGYYWPTGYEQTVGVTGFWGWPAVPPGVRAATTILAVRYVRRMREAPFGVVTVGVESGAAMRIARTDPDVASMLEPYDRRVRLL